MRSSVDNVKGREIFQNKTKQKKKQNKTKRTLRKVLAW